MGQIISARDVVLSGLEKTLYEIILDQSSDPIFCFDPTGIYLYINQAFSSAFGLMPSDIVGKRIWDVFPGAEGDHRFAAVKKAIETKEEVVLDVKVEAVGGIRYYMTSVTPIMDQEGTPRAAICISKEITQRKRMEQALESAKQEAEQKNMRLDAAVKELYIKSITDSLTSLYNRQHSIELLENAITKYEKRPFNLILMIIDLDFFKRINDDYGHLVGDQALAEFSEHLKEVFDVIGSVGRYGGEEFMVILQDIELAETIERMEAFRQSITNHVFSVAKVTMTFSAGLAIYEGEGLNPFIKKVDDLMYLAKHEGRNRLAHI